MLLLLLLLRAVFARENGTRVRGHGFTFVASAVEQRTVSVDATWKIEGEHGDKQTRRLRKPRGLTLARCDRAVVRLYNDNIWGCGRRSPASRAHAKGHFLECDHKQPASATVVTRARGYLGLDLFSPVFQHAMVNGVTAAAGVWAEFLADPEGKLLCHETTCAFAEAALGSGDRLLRGRKCDEIYFPNGLHVAVVRGDVPFAGAFDALLPPYTAALLDASTPARDLLVYASRNHDAFKGKRTVANESAVVAALARVAERAGLTFELFRYESPERSARVFAAARVVVGPHGGALANLVHCEPGTIVVEIMPEARARLYYAGLAYAKKLRFVAFAASRFAYDGPDIALDPAALARAVDLALTRPS